MAQLKQAAAKQTDAIIDLDLLAQGTVNVWYDNSGFICEAYWVSGNTYFTHCEHAEALPLVDRAENLCGFMLQGVERISEGTDGYVEVNLKSHLPPGAAGIRRRCSGETPPPAAIRNPIKEGTIRVRFDRAEHYCEVLWGEAAGGFAETENPFILARADAGGALAGFRVIHTDRLAENPSGCVGTSLPTRVKAASV